MNKDVKYFSDREYKVVDIVYTRSRKIFPIGSWLIRLWTGNLKLKLGFIPWIKMKPYSHVARGYNVRDNYLYFQSSKKFIHSMIEEEFLKENKIVKRYKLLVPKEIDEEIRDACIKQYGKKYGLMQNLGIALVDLIKWFFNKKISNPWKNGQNCSEVLYVNCYRKMIANLNEKTGYKRDTIKPHQTEKINRRFFRQIDEEYWVLEKAIN